MIFPARLALLLLLPLSSLGCTAAYVAGAAGTAGAIGYGVSQSRRARGCADYVDPLTSWRADLRGSVARFAEALVQAGRTGIAQNTTAEHLLTGQLQRQLYCLRQAGLISADDYLRGVGAERRQAVAVNALIASLDPQEGERLQSSLEAAASPDTADQLRVQYGEARRDPPRFYRDAEAGWEATRTLIYLVGVAADPRSSRDAELQGLRAEVADLRTALRDVASTDSARAEAMHRSLSTGVTGLLEGLPLSIADTSIWVTFEFDSAEPSEAARRNLIAAISRYTEPRYTFSIIGYADPSGSSAHNISLSHRRALALERVLTEAVGIPPFRIRSTGAGVTTRFSRQGAGIEQNRRAVVVVQSRPDDR